MSQLNRKAGKSLVVISLSDSEPSTDSEPPSPSGNRELFIPDGQRLTYPEVSVPPGFEDACRRIDEVAEVIQPSVSSPRSDHYIQGARSWKERTEI